MKSRKRQNLTNQVDSFTVVKCIHTLRDLKLCSIKRK